MGSTVKATYAVDGRFLYVWSIASEVDDDGWGDYHGTGLKLVDLESGEIRAETLDRAQIDTVHLTPDGRSLYVIGWDESLSASAGVDMFPLFRLDAGTLGVLAMRPFTGSNLPSQIILQPVPPA